MADARPEADIRMVIAFVMIVAGLIDIPRRLSFGPATLLGWATILILVAAFFGWMQGGRFPTRSVRELWPILLFLGWAYVSFLWSTPTAPGVQNVVVVSAFVMLALLTAQRTARDQSVAPYAIKALLAATWLAAGLQILSALLAGWGSEVFAEKTTLALFLLIGISFSLAAVRYGQKRFVGFFLFLVAIVVLALARTPMAIAFALFPLSRLRRGVAGVKAIAWGGIVLLAFVVVITQVDPVRERFFDQSQTLSVGRFGVQANGRQDFWAAVWASYQDSVWIGKGVGSAHIFMQGQGFPVSQPHNDYLRILHDYGAVGLLLWILGWGKLVASTWRRWHDAEAAGGDARVHLTAFLALIALGAGMVTDNPWEYTAIMGPVGILVGLSIGLAGAEALARPAAAIQHRGRDLVRRVGDGVRSPVHQRTELPIRLAAPSSRGRPPALGNGRSRPNPP